MNPISSIAFKVEFLDIKIQKIGFSKQIGDLTNRFHSFESCLGLYKKKQE